MEACASGAMFPKVYLHARKAGGGAADTSQQTFVKYEFRDVMISSFQTSIEEESSDTVKLTYVGVVAAYGKQLKDGSISTTDSDKSFGGYDLKLNKTISDKLKIGKDDEKGVGM